jgi:hypothetical protein
VKTMIKKTTTKTADQPPEPPKKAKPTLRVLK